MTERDEKTVRTRPRGARGDPARMLLVATDPRFAEQDPGRGHVERPARLQAVHDGLEAAGLDGAIRELPPRAATRAEMERVHRAAYLQELERFCRAGGGPLDLDTSV